MNMNRAALRLRVERITNVATFPHTIANIAAIMESPTASAVEIAEEIAKDQVLTAKVLKLVNSGFSGRRQPISTITHAMVLLGFDVVRTLVISASVFDIFDKMTSSLGGLWEHSLGTARAANAIAGRLDVEDPEEYAVAGLLHDLGKVIIAQTFPAEYADIRRTIAEKNCLQMDAELEVLGVNHGEVGMWLLKQWSLPPKLLYPIAYHNNFHAAREFADRTAVVHLADILCRAKGFGNAGDARIPTLNREAWQMLGLHVDDLREIFHQVDADMAAEL